MSDKKDPHPSSEEAEQPEQISDPGEGIERTRVLLKRLLRDEREAGTENSTVLK